MKTAPKTEARALFVHLGDGEWGNELMAEVAREYFAADGTLDIVDVHEHGGWYLTYLRDGTIIGTANDMAQLSANAHAFLRANCRWVYVDDIRRA